MTLKNPTLKLYTHVTGKYPPNITSQFSFTNIPKKHLPGRCLCVFFGGSQHILVEKNGGKLPAPSTSQPESVMAEKTAVLMKSADRPLLRLDPRAEMATVFRGEA